VISGTDTGSGGISFGEAFRLWLKIGLLSFGGPAGQIALMHRLLVEEKRWISERRFLHALNYCMLLPGPEAQQLATYIGWLLHRTWGGIVAGTLFILPGALLLLLLSWLYALYQQLDLVQSVFLGIKAVVLAIVVDAVLRIGRRALKTRLLVIIAASAFVAIFFLKLPFPLIVVLAACIGFFGFHFFPGQFTVSAHVQSDTKEVVDTLLENNVLQHTRPSMGRAVNVLLIGCLLWFLPVLIVVMMLGRDHVFVQESLFFSKMAVVTFGGAYAVLAYVAQAAVETYQWLAPGEMLDGLGLAETTPGPLILVVQFVGYLAAFRYADVLTPATAGLIGTGLTLWVTFVPCFIWIFLGAPYMEKLLHHQKLQAALSAITAAVVGVILNLAAWFGLHVIFDEVREIQAGFLTLSIPEWSTLNLFAAILAVIAVLAVLRFKVGVIKIILFGGLIGALIGFL
jgi:chromate transporter